MYLNSKFCVCCNQRRNYSVNSEGVTFDSYSHHDIADSYV